jgi:mono/diheme cytochrome c family protein
MPCMDDMLRRGPQGAPAHCDSRAATYEGRRKRPRRRVIAVWLAMTFVSAACSQPTSPAATERGRRVYVANCITCHNPDPTHAGSAGPEVAGASRELLAARVLHGTYPPGYAPKRPTHNMVALPQLANKIDDLAAYLGAVGP